MLYVNIPAIRPLIIETGIANQTVNPISKSLAVTTAPRVNDPSPVKSGYLSHLKAIATPMVKNANAKPCDKAENSLYNDASIFHLDKDSQFLFHFQTKYSLLILENQVNLSLIILQCCSSNKDMDSQQMQLEFLQDLRLLKF